MSEASSLVLAARMRDAALEFLSLLDNEAHASASFPAPPSANMGGQVTPGSTGTPSTLVRHAKQVLDLVDAHTREVLVALCKLILDHSIDLLLRRTK
jgi:hypothetical protein